ncbi:MAG: class I SAM-dependent methyltransferase [Solirubrobacteraceae bacterium MAG38_C4-C5]|nr:class I SAM-dependent methyltransferase [Candidatus Siliceabacter maunaloa]
MSRSDFAPISATLREQLFDHYRARGRAGRASDMRLWRLTIETNSGLVERRFGPVLDRYLQASGRSTAEGLDVVDLGCGFGSIAVYLAYRGATVLAIDPDRGLQEVGAAAAARHGLPAIFMQGRMEESPAISMNYDLAVLNNSSCFVMDPILRRRAMAETFRVLRPGGHLVSTNPNRSCPVDPFTGWPMIHWLPARHATAAARLLGRPRSAVRLLSGRAARHELEGAGFIDIEAWAPARGLLGRAMRPIARYQHLLARRPPAASLGTIAWSDEHPTSHGQSTPRDPSLSRERA